MRLGLADRDRMDGWTVRHRHDAGSSRHLQRHRERIGLKEKNGSAAIIRKMRCPPTKAGNQLSRVRLLIVRPRPAPGARRPPAHSLSHTLAPSLFQREWMLLLLLPFLLLLLLVQKSSPSSIQNRCPLHAQPANRYNSCSYLIIRIREPVCLPSRLPNAVTLPAGDPPAALALASHRSRDRELLPITQVISIKICQQPLPLTCCPCGSRLKRTSNGLCVCVCVKGTQACVALSAPLFCRRLLLSARVLVARFPVLSCSLFHSSGSSQPSSLFYGQTRERRSLHARQPERELHIQTSCNWRLRIRKRMCERERELRRTLLTPVRDIIYCHHFDSESSLSSSRLLVI